MNYSLGNTLSRGGSLNADGLSLDLQFATDKSLTARKGPTPTFTRASTATFVGSDGLIQSAAINEPRFDHSTTAPNACRGLLIEESRTNLLFPSATLTTQTRTVTAVSHTLSFYGTGTVVLSGAHVATVIGTGAYPTRTTLTFTPSAGSLILTVTGSVTYAQLEAGSFPTSYIPTTTASVVRSADVCSITGAAFTGMYNALAGTTVAGHLFSSNSLVRPFYIGDGTVSTNTAEVFSGSLAVSSNVFSGGAQQYAQNVAAVNNTMIKTALAITASSAMIASNGTLGTAGGGLMPVGVDRFFIGNRVDGARNINGHISFVRHYKKRLSDTKLQALTTL
jgi:hypothetical protein